MRNLKSSCLSAVLLVCIAIMCLSCNRVVMTHPRHHKRIGHGPPPHARAHGHRRKCPDGFEVVYDSASGVYVVVGYPNHYYLDGHYYRFHQDRWQISVSVKGKWQQLGKRPLPPGLKAKAAKKYVSKTNPGKGHGRIKNNKWKD